MGKRSLILLLALVFAISGANGELCERLSQTHSELLLCHNHRCDRKCISWEKAVHGACHLRDWGLRCYCYFEDCSKAPPPSPGGSPPPSPGGSGKGDGAGSGGGGGGGKNPCV